MYNSTQEIQALDNKMIALNCSPPPKKKKKKKEALSHEHGNSLSYFSLIFIDTSHTMPRY
jgi:hypothetical protein